MKDIKKFVKKNKDSIRNIVVAVSLSYFYFLIAVLPLDTKSMTHDEGYHLARGVALLQTGDFRINVHHPYLGNLITALPTLFDRDIETFSEDSTQWKEANKDDITDLFIANNGGVINFSGVALYYPRVAQAFITSLFIAIYFFIVKKLFGFNVSLISTAFLALSPSIIAHGSLVTTDIQATITIFLATMALYFHVKRENSKESKFLILFLLLAFVALMVKYSSIFCTPIWVFVAFWDAERRHASPKFLKRVVSASKIGFISYGLWVLLIFLAYGAQFKTFQELEHENEDRIEQVKEEISSTGTPDALNFYQSAKLPMPYYIKGFFENVLYKNVSRHETYFLGQYHNIGPEYYLVALGTKETVLFTVSIVAALGYVIKTIYIRIKKNGKKNSIDPATLLIYSVPTFLMLLAMMSTVRLGIRHILPIIPFAALLIGVFYQELIKRFGIKRVGAFLLVGFIFSLWSILNQYPSYIGYFNELIGSSKNGYKVLHDSNLDWGQNEIVVLEYMRENSDKEIVYIDSYDDELIPGRYHIIKLVNVFGDPLYQPAVHIDIRERYENGEFETLEWIANTHWLIYYEPNTSISK